MGLAMVVLGMVFVVLGAIAFIVYLIEKSKANKVKNMDEYNV